jgi:N-acetylneuraminic acid mutarotase
MPEPRQEVASAVARGAIWVLGGFDPNRRSSDSVFAFGAGAWIKGPALPQRIDHAAAAELDGTLYYAGGFSDGTTEAALYGYATGGGWAARAPLHHPRGAHALLSVAGRLYAIGGNGPAGDEPVVEEYNPGADAWSDVATLPAPRNHVAGFVYKGLACIAGGRSPNVARVDCLDTTSHAWSRLPDLPVATSGAGAGVLGDQAFVAGGENAGESTLVPAVFRFNGRAWTSEAMLVPRHGIQLAAGGGRLWACGGATAAGYAASPRCTSIA